MPSRRHSSPMTWPKVTVCGGTPRAAKAATSARSESSSVPSRSKMGTSALGGRSVTKDERTYKHVGCVGFLANAAFLTNETAEHVRSDGWGPEKREEGSEGALFPHSGPHSPAPGRLPPAPAPAGLRHRVRTDRTFFTDSRAGGGAPG